MNIQLPSLQWFLLGALLWLSGGTLLDVLKHTLATMGNFTSKATETLKNVSHQGRI